MTIIRHFCLLLLVASISACAPLSKIKQQNNEGENNKKIRTIEVLDVRKNTNLESILPVLIQQQVVLVGESHTSYGDHQNQLAVIKALHPHWSKKGMGIGLEFVQSPYQKALDDYVAGRLTDAQMLKETQWYKRWRYDFRLYREIFHYAKENKIPLIALNAPKELTKKISKNGIAGLSAGDRRKLPKAIKASQAYRDRLTAVYQQHSSTFHANQKKLDNFIDVQLAWDASMAANAAKAIKSAKINKMVLLAGSGHVVRQAIPDRLNLSNVIIVNDLPEDISQVDFLLQSGQSELPIAGKIGIVMESSPNGVLVTSVSKLHKAGIKKGDNIISIDGINVSNSGDVKINLLDKKQGETIHIEIQRVNQASIKKIIKKNVKLF
ncbi:MAG: ChaN family lipoprotein [Thiotrichaceae bacterium]